jgi:hypothetical protein
LNNQQAIDLRQENSVFGVLELQGLIGMGDKACESGGHEAPFPPG